MTDQSKHDQISGPRALVERLRLAANGCISLKSHKGDYGLCDDAAEALTTLLEENAVLRTEKHADAEAIGALREVLLAVEHWWLDEGQRNFNGAPACIFMTRAVIKGDTP